MEDKKETAEQQGVANEIIGKFAIAMLLLLTVFTLVMKQQLSGQDYLVLYKNAQSAKYVRLVSISVKPAHKLNSLFR